MARSPIQSQQEAYDLIRRRFEIGLAPELDVRQVQTLVDAARVDVARLTAQVARDENALNLLVGSSLPPGLVPRELSDRPLLKELSPGAPSEVLLHRPDILQAEHRLKVAYADI